MAAVINEYNQRVQNLTGRVFSRLTVVERVGFDKFGKRTWRCRCECGKEITVASGALLSGNTKSCGCFKRERTSARTKTHGASGSPEYIAWGRMIDRCENPNGRDRRWYHGKGIQVCAEWRHNFPAFLAHIGPRPKRGMSVDRIDGTRGYEPGNVRWATHTEQQRNKSSNHLLTYNGETRCIAEWAELYGIPQKRLFTRLFRDGWTLHDALTKPLKKLSTSR